MTPPSDETLFAEALKLAPAERAAFLAQACAGDLTQRARIEALLRVEHEARPFLESAAEAATTPPIAPPTVASESPILHDIGHYKLLQKLGEGGCGTVYLAEQSEPVRRRVALKLIKLGMDTKEVIARFEAERQALAMMDHPNIAKVYDAGTTAGGRPYFVMELVQGVPITTFCDERKLSPAARLELFIQVCHAVQHAHQKGIIHRDIKPSNILVALHDDLPVPKVIDFGIAKATAGRLTDQTLYTAVEQFIGTPAYMSPEQAQASVVDIDTRSDIYSLGVLLYELLTGRTPFDTAELLKVGLDEMRRHIREVDPPRPSTRLSTLQGEALSTAAQRRQIAAPKLVTLIRGDLDWIVMRCLEKDRARRYDTANGLADDIQRHLHQEPVSACPPSQWYRLNKLVRRNKLAFGAAGAVTVALLLGLAASVWQAVRASRAESKARNEAAIADAVNAFLNEELLSQTGPWGQAQRGFTPQPNLTLREALDRAARNLGTHFQQQPRVEAKIRQTIGTAHLQLGDYPSAKSHLEKAVALRRQALGHSHPDTLTSNSSLAFAYQGEGRLPEARALLEQVLSKRRVALGDEHPATLAALGSLTELYQGISIYNDSPGRLPYEAILALEETRRTNESQLGPDDPDTLRSMSNLAFGYQSWNRIEDALRLANETLRLRKAKLGADHPDTLTSMHLLGSIYERAGRATDALPLLEECLRRRKVILGTDHPDTIESMKCLALVYRPLGRLPNAVSLLEDALRLSKQRLEPDRPGTFVTMDYLAVVYRDLNRWEDVASIFEQFVNLHRIKFGSEDNRTIREMRRLAGAYDRANEPEKAESLYRQVLAFLSREDRLDSVETAMVRNSLGSNLLARGQFPEAEPLLRDALAVQEGMQPDDWQTFNTRSLLGGALAGQQKFAEAEPLLVSGYEGMEAREAKLAARDQARLRDALERLVSLYTTWGKPEQVAEWQKKLAEFDARPPATPPAPNPQK